jgi:glycosyltransferase involved in cell wall biosynthesis
MPTISLTMIVRDVEAIIGHCLDSCVPFVNEVIIVDTGSTDRTKQVIYNKAPHAKILDYNENTHPEAFLLDVAETWPEIKLPGPFTSKKLLANFGGARQLGLDQATGDYVLWLDSDDVLMGGEKLQELIAQLAAEGCETAMLPYEYETDARDNVTCLLVRERLWKRRPEVVWCQPIHEVACPTFAPKISALVKVRHKRGKYGIAPQFHLRNLKVLLHWFRGKDEETVDPRMLFYLAMEESWLLPEAAIDHYDKYCEKSGSDEERAKARLYAGVIHEKAGRMPEAMAEYAMATLDASFDPDPWFSAARVAYYQEKFSKCIEWTERGFEIMKNKDGRATIFQFSPLERMYQPHIYYSFSLIKAGRTQEALDVCNAGLQWKPDEPHLIGNKKLCEAWLVEQQQKNETSTEGAERLVFHQSDPLEAPPRDIPLRVTSYMAIWIWKKIILAGERSATGYGYRTASSYLALLPEGIMSLEKKKELDDFTRAELPISAFPPNPEPKKAPRIEAPPRPALAPGMLDIVFFIGPSWEQWSPETIKKTGIGGSETAAVCMAKCLTDLGHRVTVLNDCGQMAGLYEGVHYVDYQDAENNPDAFACDVFVSSRQPQAFNHPWKFKLSILWVHDTHVGEPTVALSELLFKCDRFFCLSQWHRNFFGKETYPFLGSKNILQTRNGVDLARFEGASEERENRLIYSSSPDRGLEVLLALLPAIKAEVPDAVLHVYYGFDTWRKMAVSAKRQDWIKAISYFETLLDEQARAGNLVFHGRVNQTELAEAFKQSKVWTYPTAFHETSCITAMEAQAAGCVPVTSRLGALPETVKYGVLINPPNDSPEYHKQFVSETVRLLRDRDYRLSLSTPALFHARENFGWAAVAAEWIAVFKQGIAEKADSPLPAFGDF